MKAITLRQYGGQDLLEYGEVPKPTPKDDEVLVKIEAVAVNDWDWSMVTGKPFYIRLLCGLFRPKIGIPGVEIAGQVDAIGKNVKRHQVGGSVYGDISESGFGGFAEYVCVAEDALAKKPACMNFADAAALPHAAMLAIQGLCDIGKVQPGQKLLINGAGGGVGILGVQIAKSKGIECVTGVDTANKKETMLLAGFEKTIDYQQEDFTSKGDCYDLILDTKTTRSPFRYLRALKKNGTYVTVGGRTSRLLQLFILGPLIHLFSSKRLRIVALKVNRDLDYISELYEAGQLTPVIDGPYSLNEVPKAIQRFGEGKHKGKIVIAL